MDEIHGAANASYKVEPVFSVDVIDAQEQVVARVEKTLYVRRKISGQKEVSKTI